MSNIVKVELSEDGAVKRFAEYAEKADISLGGVTISTNIYNYAMQAGSPNILCCQHDIQHNVQISDKHIIPQLSSLGTFIAVEDKDIQVWKEKLLTECKEAQQEITLLVEKQEVILTKNARRGWQNSNRH
ncbi:hypothetical protein BC938DRAFT_471780 [Jimgerdemannia flammicorona]|uniref:Uncharacterized protein n=1 Tax=Jimgerdemannia flammicorona TaxID=994334 RepID=A0A433Q7E4_9FUNG|nr:hypothetical protein BC938DRAFT_471780 [Jimgerdemannia flammicorona]